MSVADRALWIMERNSSRSLSLSDIAESCGVSRSHLAAAFGTAVGQPVMKYLRGRRLSSAARALAAGAGDIMAVALDSGYASHEAFTRAFRDQFGVTPEALRERGTLEGLASVEPIQFRMPEIATVKPPRFVTQDVLRYVGLAERCLFQSTSTIPAQWQRFMEFYSAIEHKRAEIPVGVAHPADDDGSFVYMCAVEVDRFGSIPTSLSSIEIPARTYAVFDHVGHVSTIFATYQTIWNDALPATGHTLAEAPVIERHNPSFNPHTGEGGLTLWIPLAN